MRLQINQKPRQPRIPTGTLWHSRLHQSSGVRKRKAKRDNSKLPGDRYRIKTVIPPYRCDLWSDKQVKQRQIGDQGTVP